MIYFIAVGFRKREYDLTASTSYFPENKRNIREI